MTNRETIIVLAIALAACILLVALCCGCTAQPGTVTGNTTIVQFGDPHQAAQFTLIIQQAGSKDGPLVNIGPNTADIDTKIGKAESRPAK